MTRRGRRMPVSLAGGVGLLALLVSCAVTRPGEVRLMTLDPGHFHAALVQKTMYEDVSPVVHVYAPAGPDVEDHLARIDGFNHRSQDPTRWEEKVHRGPDYFDRMIAESPGNVVVISGDNRRKAEYIAGCVAAGLHVLADKPMCIDAAGERLLERAFAEAGQRGVLLYDIMTERHEITTILQMALAHDPAVFGERVRGTVDQPAISMESVHHFYKLVAGRPNKRPPWFFDTERQGEGIVDVTTHLVDLVLWGFDAEPRAFSPDEISLLGARRWPTPLSGEQFREVTGLTDWPADLRGRLDAEGRLPCYANGAITFSVDGVVARVQVEWHYRAPEGGGDTHRSVVRGTRARLIIEQGPAQGYRPELYVEAASDPQTVPLGAALERAIARLRDEYPGLGLVSQAGRWQVTIPDRYRLGHEAHFRQVTEDFLSYLREGRLPSWEVANMLVKYRLTTAALELARRSG